MAKPTLEVFLDGALAGVLLRKDNGNAAEELSKSSQFSEPLIQEIVTGIRKRAERFLRTG